MIDLIKEIWQTMRTNKLRTILTGISVAWGIFMLILLLSITNGLINNAEERMSANDIMRIQVWGGRTSQPYHGLKEGRVISLRTRNMEAIRRADPQHISAVEGSRDVAAIISTPKDYLSSSCTGVFPNYFTKKYKFVQGRAINEADIKQQRKVITLHEESVPILFDKTDNAVGKIVKLGNIAFTVVGVYQHDWSNSAFIPFTTAQAISGYSENLDNIVVRLQNVSNEQESGQAETSTREALGNAEKFDPADQSAIWTYDRFASYIESMKAMNILNAAMWVIGILTLITGIVGVSNIMFVSVRERTHEIGIRRAIGAKPRNLITQVVLESVALTTCFGYIGIVMGTVATEAVKYAFRDSEMFLNPSVDLGLAVQVTIALVIAGALAGLFPALRATKVKPVEALRNE